MTSNHITPTPLAFNGVAIRDRDEMLSLTDMWKAQGSDPARQPAEWLRSADAERFIGYVTETLNLGISQDDAVKTVRGGRVPGTWAHWQIGLAYAKYLSPEFHMWCNTVVREKMEGRPGSVLPTDLIEDIRRTNGICKMLSHKVTVMETAVHRLETAHAAPTFDLAGTVTSDLIIEMAGIPRKERVRGTTVVVTNAMLDFCDGVGCFRTPADLNPGRPWRFPREKARDWLFGESYGAERIRNQIAAQRRKRDKKGQRVFRLVPPATPDQPDRGA